MFNGILITRDDAGYAPNCARSTRAQLPEGDVTVRIDWSTLNYKGRSGDYRQGPVVRKFLMVPGIDFAGVVSEQPPAVEGRRRGDPSTAGASANALGRAGATGTASRRLAGSAAGGIFYRPPGDVDRHRRLHGPCSACWRWSGHGLRPTRRHPVTGANGGVGVVTALLARLRLPGHRLHRPAEEADHLRALGAAGSHRPQRIIGTRRRSARALDRRHRMPSATTPRQRLRRHPLPWRCCRLRPGAGHGFPASPLHPARVTLYGIDSVMAPPAVRREAWAPEHRSRHRPSRCHYPGEISLAGHRPPPASCLPAGFAAAWWSTVNRT